MAQRVVDSFLPEIMAPLFMPKRHKVLYGGRGGAKSHSIARALLLLGAQKKLRIACVREVQKSIKDSVHQVLKTTAEEIGLGDFYTAQETTIFNPLGTEFIFLGLSNTTAMNLKSLEGCDICWVEEAQAVSNKSWVILLPTIRKPGSEVWVSFNPELDTDPTWIQWIVNTPPDTWVQLVNYTDNPWFDSTTMESTRRHAEATMTREEYENVWLGIPRSSIVGAIYAPEIREMVKGRRYRPTPYDPQLLVHPTLDIGYNDMTAVTFFQRLYNQVCVIDYMEGSHLTYAMWAKALNKLPYSYGYLWLPWDGGIVKQDTGMSAKGQFRKLGLRARVVKKHEKETRIAAARSMFPRVYMDNTPPEVIEIAEGRTITRGCGRLMECLKRFRRTVPKTTDEPSTPVHDEFSHGADSFGCGAMAVALMKNELDGGELVFEERQQAVRGVI